MNTERFYSSRQNVFLLWSESEIDFRNLQAFRSIKSTSQFFVCALTLRRAYFASKYRSFSFPLSISFGTCTRSQLSSAKKKGLSDICATSWWKYDLKRNGFVFIATTFLTLSSTMLATMCVRQPWSRSRPRKTLRCPYIQNYPSTRYGTTVFLDDVPIHREIYSVEDMRNIWNQIRIELLWYPISTPVLVVHIFITGHNV